MLLWLVMMTGLKTPDLAKFHETCATNRAKLEATVQSRPALGETTYLPTGALERTQSTYSFDRVVKGFDAVKADLALHPGGYDGGKAAYPPERHITGIYYRGKVHVIDGHHRSLISTYLGAQTIPVIVVEDWSSKSPAEFYAELEAKQLSNFRGLNGEKLQPGSFCDMINDPLLLLARKLLLRVDLDYDKQTGRIEIQRTRGADVPIGLKINRDVPFLEQEIAFLLRRAGIEWKKGDDISMKDRERYLKILEDNVEGTRLKEVLLLDKPTKMVDLDLVRLIRKHFDRHKCEFQMTAGDGD